ncbi:MAG: hypothetical protein ACERKJ_09625 [Candidatus Dadabacteria bacterium]
MTSIWKLDGQDIYVDTFNDLPHGEAVELNPLNSTASIYHKLFNADDELQFQGTIIGETYKDNIFSTHLNEVTLISDLVPSGFTVLVMNIQMVRTPSMSQFVDRAQAVTVPVFRANITARVV